jgi:cell division protein FtsB
MKNFFSSIDKYRRRINKYWVAVILFIVVTFFMGDSTISDRIFYNKQISKLKSEIGFYSKEKEKNEEKLKAIRSSDESLEKFAREQYLMTKSDEELFIIDN